MICIIISKRIKSLKSNKNSLIITWKWIPETMDDEFISFVNIFIPTKLFVAPKGVLFGYHRLDKRSLNVNITATTSLKTRISYHSSPPEEISVLGTIDTDQPALDDRNGAIGGRGGGHRQRLLTDDNGLNGDHKSNQEVIGRQFWCELLFADNELSLKCCLIDGRPINAGAVTLIHYDTRDFMSSQLFGKEDDTDNRMAFVEFIIDSLKQTSNLFKTHLSSVLSADCSQFPVRVSSAANPAGGTGSPREELRLMLPRRLTSSFIEFQHNADRRRRPHKTHVRNKSWFPNQRQITSAFMDTVMMTTTGNQLRYRCQQFRHCWLALKGLRHKRISVDVGNVLSSVAIDIILGVITTLFLVFYSSPSYWLDAALKHTDSLVNEVQSLLNLLMGMPAGLKLNRPLNTALGQFFLYHIYLWKTYMIIIKPLFAITVETLVYCGVLGFTCIISVLSDLVSLATIHIYCFYGYAARLYGLQVVGLSALWRLFRGKKWNQLRARVDSYSYGNDQLFIGTLSFTILLFLLPTVLMYYLVFLVLRVVTLSCQGALCLCIEYMSSMPLYMICLWIVGSKKVAARVSFELIIPTAAAGAVDYCPPTVQLLLRTQKVPFRQVLGARNEEIKSSLSGPRVSWSDFIQSVIWGRIIYPL
ncbi:unnamed protein product [Oppiella nova]|uniref:Phosphatidylinositol N-acetylglucosaminyltransferase subunit Q n=1 Tax=Oppiella nova TaxID=334625 RepID=A0A7R9QKI7_9ACAR|nr:unnamed protein product [Oppiella nova]CAG2166817.1 unnamed protein product [Oppiella nova]